MKRSLALLGVLCLLSALGCQNDNDTRPRNVHTLIDSKSQGDLTVRLKVEKAFYQPGEKIHLEITAINNGSEPIQIQSRSSALAKADFRRHDGMRWETVRTFPQAAAMVITPWQLEPGQTRQFELGIDISEDWPTAETLRLRGWLNGKDSIKPTVEIKVVPDASPLENP